MFTGRAEIVRERGGRAGGRPRGAGFAGRALLADVDAGVGLALAETKVHERGDEELPPLVAGLLGAVDGAAEGGDDFPAVRGVLAVA